MKKSKSILIIIVLLIACNTTKNLVNNSNYNLSAKLPGKGKLLSIDEAKQVHKKMDVSQNPDPLSASYSYLEGNVLVDFKLQTCSDNISTKGIKQKWTMKDWSSQKINIFGSSLKNYRKGNTNGIEYLTYSLDFDQKEEKVRKNLKDIMVLQGNTMCEIKVYSLPQDSLNSKKVFNYIIKHLQINKDTLVQAH